MLIAPKPAKTNKTNSVGPNRLGTDVEKFIENSLKKSFDSSDGTAGNALLEPETEVHPTFRDEAGFSKSALTSFGINRQQLELMGIGERKIQDRIYRTLTMWSSSMYDSLNVLANGNPDLTGKLWAVYLRLVEVCNPQSEILSIEQRRLFEANMQKASNDLERTRMKAEEDHRRIIDRLKETEKVAVETKSYAMTTIPNLKEEIAGLQRSLESERQRGQQRLAEMLIAKQTSNDILTNLEEVETNLHKTKQDLRKTTDQLHVAQTEVNRITTLYNSAHEEVERIHSSTKEATSKEQRMRDKLSSAAKSKEQTESELQQSRKVIIDRQQDVERMKVALREANAVRISSLHILKDLVLKYRDVTRFLCESDKAQIDFVKENVEHGNVGLEDLDHLHVADNMHALLHLKHHLSTLPRGVLEEGHLDSHNDLSAVEEKELCDRISVWVESIDSHASAVDRKAVQSIVENIEDIFERRLAVFDAMEEELAKTQRRNAAAQLMSDNWIEQLCDERAEGGRLREEVVQQKADSKIAKAELARLNRVNEGQEQELVAVRQVARGYEEAVGAMKVAQRERKEALDKYALTHALEHQVEALEKDVAQAKDRLREERDNGHTQEQMISRLRVEIEKKQKSLDEANAVSISLLSMMGALNEETSLQTKATDDSLACLQSSRAMESSIASLPLTALHSKLQHAEVACESLLDAEKDIVVGVMQHVVDMRARIDSLVVAASRAVTYRSISDNSQDEMESLKAWVGKERARFNKNLEECRQQARNDLHHLREEIAHLNGQLRKAKEKGEKDHMEKIELLKNALELEQQLARAQAAHAPSQGVPDSRADRMNEIENGGEAEGEDAVVPVDGGGEGGSPPLPPMENSPFSSDTELCSSTTSAPLAPDSPSAKKTLHRSTLVDAVNLQVPAEPLTGPEGRPEAPDRRGVKYYINPQDVKVDADIVERDMDSGVEGLLDLAQLGIAPSSPPRISAQQTPRAGDQPDGGFPDIN